MERLSTAMALFAVFALFLVTVPEVSAVRYIVGSSKGWTNNVNYTIWAQDKHFYNGDWLFFVYDRNQNDVLEVNKTNYETCNAEHPLHNYTTGAGRDVVPLNVTRHFYFISSKGGCYGGMKLAVRVENPPPPPHAAPVKNEAWSSYTLSGQIVVPAAFAMAALWGSLRRVW